MTKFYATRIASRARHEETGSGALYHPDPVASLLRRGRLPLMPVFSEDGGAGQISAIAASILLPISRYGVRPTACISLRAPQKYSDMNLHGSLLTTGMFLPWLQFSGIRIVYVQPGTTLLLLSPSSPFGPHSALEDSKAPEPFLDGNRVFLDGRHPAFSSATAFPPTVWGTDVFDPLLANVAPVFLSSVFCLLHTCPPNKSVAYFPTVFPSAWLADAPGGDTNG